MIGINNGITRVYRQDRKTSLTKKAIKDRKLKQWPIRNLRSPNIQKNTLMIKPMLLKATTLTHCSVLMIHRVLMTISNLKRSIELEVAEELIQISRFWKMKKNQLSVLSMVLMRKSMIKWIGIYAIWTANKCLHKKELYILRLHHCIKYKIRKGNMKWSNSVMGGEQIEMNSLRRPWGQMQLKHQSVDNRAIDIIPISIKDSVEETQKTVR
jgi:hypothetical protein